MNCDKCLTLLSEYLDDELDFTVVATVEKHLEICAPCAEICEEFSAIAHCCVEVSEHIQAPPNSQALWLRINNLIESEQVALSAKETQTAQAKTAGRWSRFMNRSWQLSVQQMTSAVAGIVVITALVTVVSLQNSSNSSINNLASAQPNLMSQFLGSFGFGKIEMPRRADVDSRLKEQQMAIDYWNRRVEIRKQQWNKNVRDAFERNVREIDGVLVEYQQQLQANPNDEVSEEILDSALSDKMELLREFSKL